MATVKENKVAQETENVENKTETNEQVQENQEPKATVVDLTANEKKGGFFRDMSIGAKIGFGFTIGLVLAGGVYIVKKVFFSGDDDDDDAVETDGTVE